MSDKQSDLVASLVTAILEDKSWVESLGGQLNEPILKKCVANWLLDNDMKIKPNTLAYTGVR